MTADVVIPETIDPSFEGLAPDVPDAVYHADPALSSTLLRKLIPPSTPAHARYYLDHGRPDRPEFDLGHIVHQRVLGVGPQVEVVDGHRNATAVKDRIAAARAAGRVPLKTEQAEVCRKAEVAVRAHSLAGPLFEQGAPEVSGWWVDPDTATRNRLRADWLRDLGDGRVLVVDLKTTSGELGAAHGPWERHATKYGYFHQAAHYGDGLEQLLPGVALDWWWVVVELDPPFAVNVVPADPDSVAAARVDIAAARALYAACDKSGEWPGYPVQLDRPAQLPRWAR